MSKGYSRDWVDGLILAFQFYTILPITKEVHWSEKSARASLLFLPLTGLVLGSILAFVYLLFPISSISLFFFIFLLLFLSIVYSGALHLDGWMDVSDAIFSHREKERKLEIMKDPRVGPFAVISLFFILGWRLMFMHEAFMSEVNMVFFLLVIPFLTRWSMGLLLIIGKSAKEDGLLVAFKPVVNKFLFVSYFFWLVAFITAITFIAPYLLLPSLILLFIVACIILSSILFFERQIGGFTGDTIGATGEGGETILWMTAWLLACFVMG